MDNIDITDTTFSLDGYRDEYLKFDNVTSDYSILIYICMSVIICIGLYFGYKYYVNREKYNNENDIDCLGGFCTMNKNNDVN